MKKKIIVNARFLTQRISGVQRVGIEICKLLKKTDLDITFVTPQNILHHNLSKELEAVSIGLFTSHLWEQFDLKIYLLKKNKPLLISFGSTGPLFYKNQIISIYDMGYKLYPKWFSKKLVYAYSLIIPNAARNSKYIFTDSLDAKKDIIKLLNINPSKVGVIPLGVADIFTLRLQNMTSELLNKNYILTVSSHHPRKNFKRLVEAFSMIEDKNLKLYVIGNVNAHFSNDNQILLENLDDRIVLLKGINDEELVNFYNQAKLFIYPSLYEGFGIPILEAMSQNTECLISDIPVFREIFGDTVGYFNPESVNSICNQINNCVKNPKPPLELKDIAKINCQKYSWEAASKKVLQYLKKI